MTYSGKEVLYLFVCVYGITVMRTLGSYRLLLNTYLWAHMKCERASQKGIRITAQHGEEGDVGVFLIMVSGWVEGCVCVRA